MKKKLLFVITQMYRGGAEMTLANLLNALDSDKYDVDMLVLSQPSLENSLLSDVPSWVRLCDAGGRNQAQKVRMTRQEYLLGGDIALRFVADKCYDFAFSYGEWCPLSFVADCVQATQKAVWIHTDITASLGFDEKAFFDTFVKYRYYIFVSEITKNLAEMKYPFLRGKSRLIHNLLNRDRLLDMSAETVDDFKFKERAAKLITVANVRTEKGYLRILETAHMLKNKGFKFQWLCIGSFSDAALKRKLDEQIHALNLGDNLILLGTRANPHPYTRKADVFVLLSDYESWPLAMAEAMLLGKSAIATKTSGAKTHIQNEVNGLLCGFEARDAADAILRYYSDDELRRKLNANAGQFTGAPNAKEEFMRFVDN